MTDEYWEDVQRNPLFHAFLEHVDLGLEEGARQGWIVCVPQRVALEDYEVEENVLMDYVLVQSQDKEDPTSRTLSGKTVQVHKDFVELKEGFEEARQVPILFEESRYTKDALPLQVLCLRHRFEGGPVAPGSADLYTGRPVLRSYVSFLVSSEHNDPVLRPLNTSLRDFNNDPSVTFEFVQAAPRRLASICRSATDALIKANPQYESAKTNSMHLRQLQRAVEAYVLGGTYEKVFGTMRTLYEDVDDQCASATKRLAHVSQGELGVRREVQSLCTGAIRELEELNYFLTPVEKIGCLSRAIDLISDGVASKFAREQSVVLSMDDLLPLVIHCIVKARVEFLMTNCVYMQHFQVATDRTSEAAYHIATLEAAVEYLRKLPGSIRDDNVGGEMSNPSDGGNSLSLTFALPLMGLKLLPRKLAARLLRPKHSKKPKQPADEEVFDPTQYTELQDLGQVEGARAAAAPLPPGKAGEWYAEYYHTVRVKAKGDDKEENGAANTGSSSDFVDPVPPVVDHTPSKADLGFSSWEAPVTEDATDSPATKLTATSRAAQLDEHPLLIDEDLVDHDGTPPGTHPGGHYLAAADGDAVADPARLRVGKSAEMPVPTKKDSKADGVEGEGPQPPQTLTDRAFSAFRSLKAWGVKTLHAGIETINEAQRPIPVSAREREARLRPQYRSGFGDSPNRRRKYRGGFL